MRLPGRRFGGSIGIEGCYALISAGGKACVFRVATDCNEDGIADACNVFEGTSPDCNDNVEPDACDFAEGTSQDPSRSGIPDGCGVLMLAVCG